MADSAFPPAPLNLVTDTINHPVRLLRVGVPAFVVLAVLVTVAQLGIGNADIGTYSVLVEQLALALWGLLVVSCALDMADELTDGAPADSPIDRVARAVVANARFVWLALAAGFLLATLLAVGAELDSNASFMLVLYSFFDHLLTAVIAVGTAVAVVWATVWRRTDSDGDGNPPAPMVAGLVRDAQLAVAALGILVMLTALAAYTETIDNIALLLFAAMEAVAAFGVLGVAATLITERLGGDDDANAAKGMIARYVPDSLTPFWDARAIAPVLRIVFAALGVAYMIANQSSWGSGSPAAIHVAAFFSDCLWIAGFGGVLLVAHTAIAIPPGERPSVDNLGPFAQASKLVLYVVAATTIACVLSQLFVGGSDFFARLSYWSNRYLRGMLPFAGVAALRGVCYAYLHGRGHDRLAQ